jgi:trehalose-phosphatase
MYYDIDMQSTNESRIPRSNSKSRPFSLSTYNNLIKRRFPGRESGKKLSLFLDFDGTLTPVAGHPDDALLSVSMRELIIALSKCCPVVIISGRGIYDLKEKVAIDGLTYVGNHGMEMTGHDFSFIYDIGTVESEAISEVAARLSALAASYAGAVLEEKGLTLSVHYRLLSEARKPLFLKKLDKILGPYDREGLIKITGGKGLVEVRPTADWDKGSAVEWLLDRGAFKGTIPISMGDDETDEDAFRAVEGRGLSIFVGTRKSAADLFVPRQRDVEPMLKLLMSG